MSCSCEMTEPFVVMQRDEPIPNEYLANDQPEGQMKAHSIGDHRSFESEVTFMATPNFCVLLRPPVAILQPFIRFCDKADPGRMW
jgi:hypothetical protein